MLAKGVGVTGCFACRNLNEWKLSEFELIAI